VQNKIIYSLFFALSTLLLISCNDSPTDLGSGFLNQDNVQVLKLDSSIDSLSQSSYYFKKVFSLGTSDQVLLGKAENVTSHILLKFVFALPDSFKNDIKDNKINVLDSWVELIKDYSFGDSNSAFDYDVYKINEYWNSSTFTADSFAFLSYDNSDLSANHNIKNDSLFSFNLDVSLAKTWLQNNADTTLASNEGIVISPKPSINKIIGFTAYNITATNDPRLKIVVQKPGVYVDTLTGFVSSDISVVTGNLPSVGNENIAVQSSLSSQAKLFFDLSVIPANSVINSATLTLTVDTLETKTGSGFTNALRVYPLKDSTTKEVNTNYPSTLSRSGNTFIGSITNIIRAFNNGIVNQGLLIKTATDLIGVEIFAFKGSNAADINKRPKLEIVYTRKK